MFSLHNCTKLSVIVTVTCDNKVAFFYREKAAYPVTATVTAVFLAPLQAALQANMSAAVKYGPNHWDIIYLFSSYFTASVLALYLF